jgi:predicted DNA-binding transcriptional regulator AlpA
MRSGQSLFDQKRGFAVNLENTDPLLTDKEAAKILGVCVATFWRWNRVGIAPTPVKLGGITRWPRSEILALIEKAKTDRRPQKIVA